MNEQDLAKLAARCATGDHEAFRTLVESKTRTLIALAYRFAGDWESARDLTQETWIKVYKAIDRYDPHRPFDRWLYSIHRNTCLSFLRSRVVRHESRMKEYDMIPADTAAETEDAQASIERREFFERLLQALTGLSENQRKVFLTVDVEQVGQREAARLLKMSFGTLRSTLFFARRRLAGILRNLEETP